MNRELQIDGQSLNSEFCKVDSDLNEHLGGMAELCVEEEAIEQWKVNELCRVLTSKKDYDDHLTEAVYGARHETEYAALHIAMRTADCDEGKLAALYEFNSRVEEWIREYITGKAEKNRAQILQDIANENEVTMSDL
jgi:hypothetical protein